MKILRIANPFLDFAGAVCRGAWVRSTDRACQECGTSGEERQPPLIMEWERGSERVGDFIWAGFAGEGVAVTPGVVDALSPFMGFRPGPVEVIGTPVGGDPRASRRLEVPHAWPTLAELLVTHVVNADMDRSTVEVHYTCPKCGYRTYKVDGVELLGTMHWTGDRGQRPKARVAGKGIHVRSRALAGHDIFRVREFPSWIFCSEAVRDVIRGAGFTNITFLEMGDSFIGPAIDAGKMGHGTSRSQGVRSQEVVKRNQAVSSISPMPPRPSRTQGSVGGVLVRADDLPADNADLAKVQIDFPRLSDDSPVSSPVPVDDILQYLADEAPGGEMLTAADLVFLRTAQVEATRYWIWRFVEPDGGEPAYVTVSESADGSGGVGYDANSYGLSPEQFILGDYRDAF